MSSAETTQRHTATKPQPVHTRWSEEFHRGLANGEFLLQLCERCKAYQGYPKPLCHRCGHDQFDWRPSTGRGRIYSFTSVESNPPTPFVADLPYVLVIVELDEGVRYLARYSGDRPAECDLSVRAVFEQRNDGVRVPTFTAET